MAVWVAGVDGCRAGWLVVEVCYEAERARDLSVRVVPDDGLTQITASGNRPVRVALDIPIGLLEAVTPGGRICDQAARKFLGRPRSSSVFSPPVRPLLGADTFAAVRGRGMTLQGFHIMGKIAAVDAWMTPARGAQVVEAHPEVAFARRAGRAMAYPKRLRAGRQERLDVLRTVFPDVDAWLDRCPARRIAAPDDFLDALVLADVAFGHLNGRAVCLPPHPPRDARGLDMAIWS